MEETPNGDERRLTLCESDYMEELVMKVDEVLEDAFFP